MENETEKRSKIPENSMKITVNRNGPYIVTGRVPLIVSEIVMGRIQRFILTELKKETMNPLMKAQKLFPVLF